jgi:hypothetical protein
VRILSQLEFLNLPAGTAYIDRDDGGISIAIKGASAPPGGVSLSETDPDGGRVFFWKTSWKIYRDVVCTVLPVSEILDWAHYSRRDLEAVGALSGVVVDSKRSKITGECVRETPVSNVMPFYEVLENRELEMYIMELMRAWHLLNVAEITHPPVRPSWRQRVVRFFRG